MWSTSSVMMRGSGVAFLMRAPYSSSSFWAVAAGRRPAASAQKLDDEYGARIKKATPDPRIITELVDHMPASATVPSPLKFLGYVPGEPGHMSYHADIVRYLSLIHISEP